MHGKERKIRRSGRHTAPSKIGKGARRAAKVAPAVAVVGAVAAVLSLHDSGSTAATAGRSATARLLYPDQALGAPADSLHLFKDDTSRFRHPTPGTSSSATAKPRPSRSASSSASSSASPSISPDAATTGTLNCSGTSGMLPANYAAIVSFLTAHGYTGIAAAGIAGNMYQESKGNPESVGSGGGGLIGWTPLPAGFVTGNVAADLQTQLEAVLTFNQQWSAYIPALNAATTAAAAADIYMDDFERPGIPAAGNREAAATAVAQACGL